MSWQRILLAVAAVAFLSAAFAMRLSFFAFALYALAALSLVAYLMTWSALDGLETERHCTRREVEAGESIVVTVAVRNRKPLPTLWLVAEDLVPRGLKAAGTFARATLLMPMASCRLRYRLDCERRGYFRVGPVLFETGDFFGLNRRFATGAMPQYITVYPRVVPLAKYAIPTFRPLGETVVKRRLMEDPTRLAGVREYQTGDPLRRIHWKATARTGQLHSRIYEASTLIGANIVLDFGRAAWGDGDPDRAELAVTTAASIAAHLADRRQQIGLVTNGGDASDVMPESPERVEARTRQRVHQLLADRERSDRLAPVHIPVRRGEHQLTLIMHALARLRLTDALTCAELIADECQGWPREASTIVIVPGLSAELLREVVRLRNSGFTVLVIVIDNQPSFARSRGVLEAEGVHVMHVVSEADLNVISL